MTVTIEGHINIWFNRSSFFKMEFNQVNVQEVIIFLRMIQSALAKTEPETAERLEQEGV